VANLKVFDVTYQIALRAGAVKGPRDSYRKPIQQAAVAAATANGVGAVLGANLALAGAEIIEIVDVHEHAVGGQGIYT